MCDTQTLPEKQEDILQETTVHEMMSNNEQESKAALFFHSHAQEVPHMKSLVL